MCCLWRTLQNDYRLESHLFVAESAVPRGGIMCGFISWRNNMRFLMYLVYCFCDLKKFFLFSPPVGIYNFVRWRWPQKRAETSVTSLRTTNVNWVLEYNLSKLLHRLCFLLPVFYIDLKEKHCSLINILLYLYISCECFKTLH